MVTVDWVIKGKPLKKVNLSRDVNSKNIIAQKSSKKTFWVEDTAIQRPQGKNKEGRFKKRITTVWRIVIMGKGSKVQMERVGRGQVVRLCKSG